MFNRKNFLCTKFILLFFLTFTIISAQNKTGKITGTVVDKDFGDALIGANVFIEGTTIGAATDIEGRYAIDNIPVGAYTVVYSMIGFQKQNVTGVIVKHGEVTKMDVALGTETYETEEVIISAKVVEDSEAGLLIKRQKSVSVSDAISSEQFSRAGSGNAAEAVKQIVGASVVDGKNVYVRGLGDRYTSTQLNGAEIPSVDPYKRSGSIDLIPANLVDNIQAVKSFTPDKQGNFSGGTVDIKTKDFPDKLNVSFSASTSYNSNATFNSDFLGVHSSGTDWMGSDDGYRDIPSEIGEKLIISAGNATKNDSIANAIDVTTKSFNSDFNTFRESPPLNQSYALSIGNQIDLLGKPFGFIASLTYKNSTSGYSDGSFNRWDRGVMDPEKSQLDTVMNLGEQATVHEVLWGAVLKGSYKLTPEHILSVNGLFNQNGENKARFLAGSFPYDTRAENSWQATTHHYKERSLKSVQLSGQHYFKEFANLKVEWKGNYLESNQDEPDLRYFYSIVTPDDEYIIKTNLQPERYFRYTDENQRGGQIDFSLPFHLLSDKQSTFKFGGYYQNKRREFRERRFSYEPKTALQASLNEAGGDVARFFSDEFLGWVGYDTISFAGHTTINNLIGIYVQEGDQKSSNYNGESEISAYYGMFDIPVGDMFRVITGARYENTNMEVINFTDSLAQINTHDLLPSVNVVYSPMKDMNIRLSYGKTLARPTFREISPFVNFEFNGGDTYRGYTKLKRTLIDNFDLRWEWYTGAGQIFAVSGFYKDFRDPIVLKITDAVNSLVEWRNVPEAIVYGLEFEIRKNLEFLSESLVNFSMGANLTLIHSQVDIDPEELENLRVFDPDADNTRPFHGQSPYIINANINYDDWDNGLTASLFYNVSGRRLTAVGSVGAPDVYEEAFHLLNFSLSKKVYENISLKLSVNNILNDRQEKIQEFKGTEYIYSSHTKGVSYSVGMKYSF